MSNDSLDQESLNAVDPVFDLLFLFSQCLSIRKSTLLSPVWLAHLVLLRVRVSQWCHLGILILSLPSDMWFI